MFFADVVDGGVAGFDDAESKQAEHRDQGEVEWGSVRFARLRMAPASLRTTRRRCGGLLAGRAGVHRTSAGIPEVGIRVGPGQALVSGQVRDDRHAQLVVRNNVERNRVGHGSTMPRQPNHRRRHERMLDLGRWPGELGSSGSVEPASLVVTVDRLLRLTDDGDVRDVGWLEAHVEQTCSTSSVERLAATASRC